MRIHARLPLALLLIIATAPGSGATPGWVPPELEPWIPWVMEGEEFRGCPFLLGSQAGVAGDFRCVWPGVLTIETDRAGASFSQEWTVIADEQWVPLPGEPDHWPVEVTVDGRAARVFARGGLPALRLAPGEYRLNGRLRWESSPQTLQIPAESGLVRLVLDGERIGQPQRSDKGLYLGRPRDSQPAADAISLQVFRLVEDQIPSLVTTLVRLEISGSVREETLGPVLPPGFVPQSLAGRLPARVEPDGSLRLQAAPGSHTLSLVARAADLLDEIRRPDAAAPWPATEIWSYRGDDRLRVATPTGLVAVDPGQAGVPARWSSLPAFSMAADGVFRLEERRRGGAQPENSLTLDRSIWLDFDGDGLTVVDSLRGEMHQRWRLAMRDPYTLLGARSGAGQPVLISSIDGEAAGFEWRASRVEVQAVSRLADGGEIPASGWSERLDAASATVHLPPGHRLGAAFGADRAPDVWLSRWRLLDLFVVLLSAAAAGRLYGRSVGLLTLATLVVLHQDLPAFSWLLLNLLVANALSRVAPEGRLRLVASWYGRGSLAAIVLLLIPFAVTQIKLTLYPQLESYAVYQPADRAQPTLPAAVPSAKERMADAQVAAEAVEEAMVSGAVRLEAGQPSSPQPQQLAPGVRVQTGPGLPAWRWNTYRLGWSGPVAEEQTLRLVILPRWLVAIWRIAMVTLAAFTLWWLARDSVAALRRIRVPLGGSAAGLALLALVAGGVPADVRAEVPPPQVLNELRQRLLRAPDCVPDCGAMVAAEATIGETRMELALTVNALARIAVPVPGAERDWMPDAVEVDGAPARGLYRDDAGTLWLALDPGSHRIRMRGRLPEREELQVVFPAVPMDVVATATGWTVDGIRGRRLVAGALTLRRVRETVDAVESQDWDGTRFPVHLRIERTVVLGLEWEVSTRVRRVAPADGGISVTVPLLDGEAVTTEGVTVEAGRVLAALGSGQQSFEWRSALSRESPLSLSAPADEPWTEIWQFEIADLWHATLDGVPVYESGGPYWRPTYLPRPGETLTLAVTRPTAVEGATLAVDRVSSRTEFGARASQTSLEFDYRSSLGGPQTISLPEGAEPLSLTQDGQALPLPAPGEPVRIPALPGSHGVQVSWRDSRPMGFRTETPAVGLAAPTGNIAVSAAMPANRWILLAMGPDVGPAVLYWSQLAALALAALALGRIRTTPLKSRHWLLLGLGFSTFAWSAFGLVVVWLLAMAWRGHWPEDMPDDRFRLLQTAIGLLSVFALLGLVSSIPVGLLGTPDMHIAGNGSFGQTLNWFQDRSDGALPVAAVLSAPLWIYKIAILLWALWLSFALVRWLPWAWQCFSRGGIWRGRVRTSSRSGD